MRARVLGASLAFALFGFSATASAAEDDVRFDIVRFQVDGNTLLPQSQVDTLMAPFIGRQRLYGDIQKALEAMENAYRKAGYGTIQVYVPEQELTSGIVRIQVTEAVVGKVTVTGNKLFDDGNVRAGLPALQEGKAPNMRELSENIQLSNGSPAKQVEVVLGVGKEDGTVDAKISVTEEDPERVMLTLDNTGTAATGKHRLGVAYQNANLMNRDQVLTLAYAGAPDAPEGVKVDVLSVGYRLPLYGIGDSVDFIYGQSSVNTPSSTLALGSPLAINGKGDIIALRWNHHFPRRGEYSGKLIFGLDYKHINASCNTNGNPTPIDPPNGGGASCTPYTTRPLSVTYAGGWQRMGELGDYSLGLAHNWSLGSRYATPDGASQDRYSLVSGNRQTRDDFTILKVSGSWLKSLEADWQLRLAGSAQYAATPLPIAEQFGLAGSTTVRGFNERAVAADTGWVGNVEVYTPDLAHLAGLPGNLRALAFYDFGRGRSWSVVRGADTAVGPFEKYAVASMGLGLRYALKKDVSLRLDLAQVTDAGPADVVPGTTATFPANTEGRGDWRGHFALSLGF